jgi:hypothetical protein
VAYAETDELARILKIRTPSTEQTAALDRVLEMAAGEIDAELDLAADTVLSVAGQATVEQVNLQRAAELWFAQEVPLGITGIGGEFGTTHLARDSWAKYTYQLAHLKDQRGFA